MHIFKRSQMFEHPMPMSYHLSKENFVIIFSCLAIYVLIVLAKAKKIDLPTLHIKLGNRRGEEKKYGIAFRALE